MNSNQHSSPATGAASPEIVLKALADMREEMADLREELLEANKRLFGVNDRKRAKKLKKMLYGWRHTTPLEPHAYPHTTPHSPASSLAHSPYGHLASCQLPIT